MTREQWFDIWNTDTGRGVPEYVRSGIQDYIDNRIPLGPCLTAIFANDLFDAYGKADTQVSAAMRNIVSVIYQYAPRACWGSRKMVAASLNTDTVSPPEEKPLLDYDAGYLAERMEGFMNECFNGTHHEGAHVQESEVLAAWRAACKKTGYFTRDAQED